MFDAASGRTGHTGLLKDSAAYPTALGEAVIDVWESTGAPSNDLVAGITSAAWRMPSEMPASATTAHDPWSATVSHSAAASSTAEMPSKSRRLPIGPWASAGMPVLDDSTVGCQDPWADVEY